MINENFKEAVSALKENGEFSSLTSGNSMRPLFKTHRDIIVIKPVTKPLKANDVVLYKKSTTDKLVLHRLLKITPNGGFIIRGDNTYRNETDVKESDIVGVLDSFYRNGKYCSCQAKKYKLYVAFIRATYPARYLWKVIARPTLIKIYHSIFN